MARFVFSCNTKKSSLVPNEKRPCVVYPVFFCTNCFEFDPDVVFCYGSSPVSWLRCFSTMLHGCKEWLFELSCQLEPVWPINKKPTLFFSKLLSVENPRRSVVSKILKTAYVAPTVLLTCICHMIGWLDSEWCKYVLQIPNDCVWIMKTYNYLHQHVYGSRPVWLIGRAIMLFLETFGLEQENPSYRQERCGGKTSSHTHTQHILVHAFPPSDMNYLL